MDSGNINALEKPTQGSSTTAVSNGEYTACTRGKIEPPSDNVDDLPPTEFPVESTNNPSMRLLNTSHPQYSAVGVTVPSNGLTNLEEREHTADQSSTITCSTFWDWYTNKVITFRNSCFIYIIHLLISYAPISGFSVGLAFYDDCPQMSFLPIFVAVVGLVGIVFVVFFNLANTAEQHGVPCSSSNKFLIGMVFMLLSILTVMEMFLFSHIYPNPNSYAEDYCSNAFYYILFGKEVMTVIALITGAVIYFPGSALHTCWQDCAMPSPAGAFFHSL